MECESFLAKTLSPYNKVRASKKCYQRVGVPIPKAPLREGYEGPVNVPVDAQLYHALANEAAEARMSLYALVAQKLRSTEYVVQEG